MCGGRGGALHIQGLRPPSQPPPLPPVRPTASMPFSHFELFRIALFAGSIVTVLHYFASVPVSQLENIGFDLLVVRTRIRFASVIAF